MKRANEVRLGNKENSVKKCNSLASLSRDVEPVPRAVLGQRFNQNSDNIPSSGRGACVSQSPGLVATAAATAASDNGAIPAARAAAPTPPRPGTSKDDSTGTTPVIMIKYARTLYHNTYTTYYNSCRNHYFCVANWHNIV